MNIYFLIGEFFVSVILVLLYYKFIETRKIKKYTKTNIPTDLKLFIYSQKIDVKKISYKKLMRIVAIINAIDIGIIVLLTNLVKGFPLKALVAVISSFLILFISYRIAGFILKKKGLTENGSQKDRS